MPMMAWIPVSMTVMRVTSREDSPSSRSVARRRSRPEAPRTAAWAVRLNRAGTINAHANIANVNHK